MLDVPEHDVTTQRLILRALRVDHAEAMWEVLRDPRLYTWIDRAPPAEPADLAARFARVAQRTDPVRAEQWLNWTVWTRDGNEPVGIVEATVPVSGPVLIAYMFAPWRWGQGFAGEAVRAALALMSHAGATGFEAVIDARNSASLRLAARLGFHRAEQRSAANEEVWRRGP
jgi:RimJ/RimL family protein N-acetyltransferase